MFCLDPLGHALPCTTRRRICKTASLFGDLASLVDERPVRAALERAEGEAKKSADEMWRTYVSLVVSVFFFASLTDMMYHQHLEQRSRVQTQWVLSRPLLLFLV